MMVYKYILAMAQVIYIVKSEFIVSGNWLPSGANSTSEVNTVNNGNYNRLAFHEEFTFPYVTPGMVAIVRHWEDNFFRNPLAPLLVEAKLYSRLYRFAGYGDDLLVGSRNGVSYFQHMT
jgi:hypothetical protein